MIIDDLLKNEKMSRYKLSKISGVPQTTISDICSGKAEMPKCTAGTLYKIAKALNVTVDTLLEADQQENALYPEYRSSFDVFKSNTCHHLKAKGDIDFIIDTLASNRIRQLYDKKWYLESLYLLGLIDYLSRINKLPVCSNYNDIRRHKLSQTVYPSGVLMQAAVLKDETIKTEACKTAIPELMRFNIVENEVRNIV